MACIVPNILAYTYSKIESPTKKYEGSLNLRGCAPDISKLDIFDFFTSSKSSNLDENKVGVCLLQLSSGYVPRAHFQPH